MKVELSYVLDTFVSVTFPGGKESLNYALHTTDAPYKKPYHPAKQFLTLETIGVRHPEIRNSHEVRQEDGWEMSGNYKTTSACINFHNEQVQCFVSWQISRDASLIPFCIYTPSLGTYVSPA